MNHLSSVQAGKRSDTWTRARCADQLPSSFLMETTRRPLTESHSEPRQCLKDVLLPTRSVPQPLRSLAEKVSQYSMLVRLFRGSILCVVRRVQERAKRRTAGRLRLRGTTQTSSQTSTTSSASKTSTISLSPQSEMMVMLSVTSRLASSTSLTSWTRAASIEMTWPASSSSVGSSAPSRRKRTASPRASHS